MAMTFLANFNGERREVPDARRFSHYVNNVQFWFAVHESPDHVACLTVSHWSSGNRVCLVTPTEQIAGVGRSPKELAKAALDKLIAKHGGERVASVLRAAEGAEQ